MLTELFSFSFPAALLSWRRRDSKYLPINSPFNMGRIGWLVNALVVGRTAFVQPVSAGSMSKCNRSGGKTRAEPRAFLDYTSLVLGLMVMLSVLNWCFYAREHYQGPNVTLLARK